jgi:muramidase (phage lysozyme)
MFGSLPSRSSIKLLGAGCAVTALVVISGCSSPTGEEEESAAALESELAVHETVTKGTSLRVNATRLNLREEAQTSSAIVAILDNDAVVRCVTTSGQDGWVHVATASGETGWAFGKYLIAEGGGDDQEADRADDDEPAGPASGATCSPSRADGAVGRYQKALHDTISFAEGTRGRSKDGYDVMFSNAIATSCKRHPNQCHAFGNTCSTAAGRYQFLTKTWTGVASARGFTTFEPENQEKGAAYQIGNVRRVTVPQGRAMTAAEFSNAMSKLSYEWASLPPGRYGQPKKSMAVMRSTYCSVAGC